VERYALVTIEGQNEEKLVGPFHSEDAVKAFESKLQGSISGIRTWEPVTTQELERLVTA
jgi:hypothetical protein